MNVGRPSSVVGRLTGLGWVLMALPMVALALRFGMRALGVRPDISIPAFVYWATTPIVEPFYSWFPAGERFDTGVWEAASLAAAGVVSAAAVGIYVVGLAVAGIRDK